MSGGVSLRGDSHPGSPPWPTLLETITSFRADGADEEADRARILRLAADADPWSRDQPLHVTGSALVVHRPSLGVLLRWHDGLSRWLHVGGHADLGEDRPFAVALREAREETGLHDLVPWPDPDQPRLVQAAVVAVPARGGEPAHEHADLRYVLATEEPERAVAETATTPLRWLSIDDAIDVLGVDNLTPALVRVAEWFRSPSV